MRITTVLQIGSALCGLAVASPAIARSGEFQTLYTFGSVPNDGEYPSATLISVNGMLYGTTGLGGPQNGGTVYAIDPLTGKETIVSNMVGGETEEPVTFYKGNFYGTADNIVFGLNLRTKHVAALYTIPYNEQDEPPDPSGLTEVGGKLFGTTFAGGHRDCGNVFSLDLATDNFTILHAFNCHNGGGNPLSLTLYRGMLYGATTEAGPEGAGTIFRVDPVNGKETTIYSQGVWSDGVVFRNGVMYGVSTYGGSGGNGALFSFDLATRKFTVLYSFPGGASGCIPIGPPVLYNGKLYGVAGACGDSENHGLLFEVSLTTREERVLYTFTGGPDGATPDAGLLLYQGALYGTTMDGGTYAIGTVFRYTP